MRCVMTISGRRALPRIYAQLLQGVPRVQGRRRECYPPLLAFCNSAHSLRVGVYCWRELRGTVHPILRRRRAQLEPEDPITRRRHWERMDRCAATIPRLPRLCRPARYLGGRHSGMNIVRSHTATRAHDSVLGMEKRERGHRPMCRGAQEAYSR